MTTATLEAKAASNGQQNEPETVKSFIETHGTPIRLAFDRWAFPDTGALLIVQADGEITMVLEPSPDEVAEEITRLSDKRSAEAKAKQEAAIEAFRNRPRSVMDLSQAFLNPRQHLDRCDDQQGRIYFEDGSVFLPANPYYSQAPPDDPVQRTGLVARFYELKRREAKQEAERIQSGRCNPAVLRRMQQQIAEATQAERNAATLYQTLLCINNYPGLSPEDRKDLIKKRLRGEPIELEYYDGPDSLVTSRLKPAASY
jgi:hypothetical protein